MPTYKIVRFYQNSKQRNTVVQTGLSLKDAESHCQSEEANSTTCSEDKAYNLRTKGPWFEGYTAE